MICLTHKPQGIIFNYADMKGRLFIFLTQTTLIPERMSILKGNKCSLVRKELKHS